MRNVRCLGPMATHSAALFRENACRAANSTDGGGWRQAAAGLIHPMKSRQFSWMMTIIHQLLRRNTLSDGLSRHTWLRPEQLFNHVRSQCPALRSADFRADRPARACLVGDKLRRGGMRMRGGYEGKSSSHAAISVSGTALRLH
jgi:hypothetical protein